MLIAAKREIVLQEFAFIIEHYNEPLSANTILFDSSIVVHGPLHRNSIAAMCLIAKKYRVVPYASVHPRESNKLVITVKNEEAKPAHKTSKEAKSFARQIATSASLIALKYGTSEDKVKNVEKTYYEIGLAIYALHKMRIPVHPELFPDDMTCSLTLLSKEIDLPSVNAAISHAKSVFLHSNEGKLELTFPIEL